MIETEIFQESIASLIAQLRIKARGTRRLTYDCLNAKVKGESVCCAEGHEFPGIGRRKQAGLSLLAVLRGRSSGACQGCGDYDGETTE